MIADQKLYNQVVSEAKRRYKVWPSAYASGWVVKEYLRRGGKYTGQSKSLQRWFQERWVDVGRWLEEGKLVPCSNDAKRYPYCRPSVRVSSQTPKTIYEIPTSELRRRYLAKARSPSKKIK